MNVLTVSQVNFYLKSIIEENDNLSDLFVSGEISNFKNHYSSGHMYFSLKDEKSIISCVMFKSFAQRVKFKLQDGLKVLLRARLGVYEASGRYQLYVFDIQPAGIGEQSLIFEQLKEKLEKKGFFDEAHKLPLPAYPEHIAVISAGDSAAFADVTKILGRRFPLAEILFYPVLVQGEDAPAELCGAIKYFNKEKNADLIIIARGGGSFEDLNAFNDEGLATEIYNSQIPIISGVGHQTDFTICDFVSDLRAATPSAAAELAVPNIEDIALTIKDLKGQLVNHMEDKLNDYTLCLDTYFRRLEALNPDDLIKSKKTQLDILRDSIVRAVEKKLSRQKEELNISCARLKALNPVSLLEKGYAVVLDDRENMIKSVKDTDIGKHIEILLSDGSLKCMVESREESAYGKSSKL